jgi:hypothetical protein
MDMRTGFQFEDEVRNIARSLYSNDLGQGSIIVDGRERDGIFWNGSFYTVVEATTEKTKVKAEIDGKKTHELVTKLRQGGHMAQGFLVTLNEPTPDQKDVIKQRRYERTTRIISFDELRSQLFDALSYINNREKKRFGSVYDHVDENFNVPLADFVEPTISSANLSGKATFQEISDHIVRGGRTILVAEYGVGKSMILRQLFHDLVKKFRQKKHLRVPIAINLRDHLGQGDPVELLERHARANAANPQNLVAAWNAGYVDLLIDGFDELSTRGWTGDVKRLKEYRRSSHAVVRKLVKDTPKGCGIIIAGRDAYFDSVIEMRDALGAREGQFDIYKIHPFDESQAMEFLRKKRFVGQLPEWIPTRPLLLTYLVTKGLLDSVVNASVGGDFPRGSAWLALIDMIASRESEQSEGVDKESLISFFGALAVRARQSALGQASFSPQVMETIFFEITGNSIREDERNILLRLPGLGAAQDSDVNRAFIDNDFMNACSSMPVMQFVQAPFSDFSKTYNFEALSLPLSSIGVDALASQLVDAKASRGLINAAIERAMDIGAMQLSYDTFCASTKFCDIVDKFTFSGIEVDEIDLTDAYFDNKRLRYDGCLIGKVILPTPDETNKNISFSECLIGSIDGRVSGEDINALQFIDCEISEYTDEYSVNSEVLGTSLPLGIRVLVVTLRKIFKQYGSSRMESALYRGLDQRAKMIVPSVIDLLFRNGFIVETGRKGKITYSGTKSKRNEALKIIQSPNTSGSKLVKDCSVLS